MQSSVSAEPRAAWLSLCRFAQPHWRKVVIWTDHRPLVDTATRGHAKTYQYNWFLAKVQQVFGEKLVVEVRFVPGEENPADEPSRGIAVSPTKVERALAACG